MAEEACYGIMLGAKMLRCLLCGERVDAVVVKNRNSPLPVPKAQPLMAGCRSKVRRSHECICGCGVLTAGVYATRECRAVAAMVEVEGKCVVSSSNEGVDFPSDFHINENVVVIGEIKI